MKELKIAIVGGAPQTRELAPFGDESWQIWVLGNQIDYYAAEEKRADLVFEVHENLTEHKDPEKYLEFVKAFGAPMVVSPKYSEWGEPYPYEAANALLDGEYLTSSPAYMMAYAILQGATEIGIYGVEMAIDDHEYFKQRPSMYAWIAYAKGRGIKITIPEESGLFKEGYCEGRDWNNAPKSGTFTVEAFEIMEKRHTEKIEELYRQIEAHNGSMQVYRNLKQIARANDAGAKNVDLVKSLRVR